MPETGGGRRKAPVVPAWLVYGLLISLAANVLAIVTTQYTIGAMGSVGEFARMVRGRDLRLIPLYNAVVIPAALLAILWYLKPVLVFFAAAEGQAKPSALVQRRAAGAPLFIALAGFAPWVFGIGVFPPLTVLEFGRWSTELMSQHVWSPLVNGFLAATTSYLLLDALFQSTVIPRVFPGGGVTDVRGVLAFGVRGRLLVTLLAVAFLPLFTMLGLVRAAAVRFEAGVPVAGVVPALATASAITFFVYVVLGLVLALLFARSVTERLGAVATALRRVQAGDVDVRLTVSSPDEVGMVEEGLNAMALALRDRERILRTFGRVVEPAVRDHLLSGEVRLGGELRTATILFCDLRGFTAMSEIAPPSEVVVTLNEFFTTISGWVRSCGGFVDKFIGDSLLVVFGLFRSDCTPAEGAAVALRCALGIRERLAELNRDRSVGGRVPLAVTMGIHTGEVLAGTIGAEDRHEYTVIGDAVNVAARLQDACKERGSELLASAATVDLARSAGFDGALLAGEPLQLRGRAAAVRVYGRAPLPE